MRPIELSIEGFGSYGRKSVIDFDRPDLNLFLIAGDTGAGKTTIFDAMTYALYASISGTAGRSGAEFRSQYPSEDSRVVLKFAMGTGAARQVYKVTRQPQRPRKRGKKDMQPEASLTLPDGTEISGVREVNAKITEIIGLTREQFSQIGMLAQGEFTTLLRASSREKSEIFRKLFRTGIFEQIQTEMEKEAKTRKAELDTWWKVVASKCSSIEIPADYPDGSAAQNLLHSIATSKEPNITLIDTLCETLGDLISFEETAEGRAAKAFEEAKAVSAAAAKTLSDAQKIADDIDAAKKAAEAFEKLSAKTPEMEELHKLAGKVQTALQIRERYAVSKKASDALGALQNMLREAEKALPGMREQAQECGARELEAEQAYQKAAVRHGDAAARHADAVKQFDAIAKNKACEAELKKRLAASEKAASDAERRRQKLEQDTAEKKKEYDSLRGVDVRLVERRNQMQNLLQAEQAFAEGTKARAAAGRAQQKVDSERAALDAVQAEYDRSYRAFYNSYAGILAAQLKEGEPCSVCGSIHHPHPHVPETEGVDITPEELHAQEVQVEAHRKRFEKAAKTAQEAMGRAKAANETAMGQLESVRDSAERDGISTDQEPKALISSVKAFLDGEIAALEENSRRAAALEKDLAGADEKTEKLRAKAHDAEVAAAQLRAELAQSRKHLEEMRARLAFASKAEADAALENAENAFAAAKKERDSAKTAHASIERDVAATETKVQQGKQELPDREQQYTEAHDAYTAMMREKDMDEQEWPAIAKGRTEADAKGYEDRYTAFLRELHQLQGAAQSAQQKVHGLAMPDLDLLSKRVREAADNEEHARTAHWRLREALKQHRRTLAELDKACTERSAMAKAYALASSLSRRLNGSGSGEHVKLETYVQRAYFENILQAANRRFRDMTGQQFELRLIELDQAGSGRGDGGLNLMVYSNSTGHTRGVSTLSGGESFMAALSLALGVADVIEQEASAVGLDMMFVDEGFGSLDDNARREAVRVLQQITGGHKLIGIISHVNELKNEIDDQLVVTKDGAGSHVEWKNT